MKPIALMLVCLLAVSLPARAGAPTLDDQTVKKVTTYYYVNKNTDLVVPILAWVEKSHIADKDTALPPLAAFLAGVFAENPDKVREWVTSVALTGKAREAVEQALWLAHRSDLILDALHDTVDYAQKDSGSLREWPLKTSAVFDMMWAMFVATGDVS